VLAFRQERTLVVALLYGEESDWVRNLRTARGGEVVRMGRTFRLGEPRILDTRTAAELARLSPPARAYCRLADRQMLAEIGERLGGFGPGRASSPGPPGRPD
jgi:hypothetical protein